MDRLWPGPLLRPVMTYQNGWRTVTLATLAGRATLGAAGGNTPSMVLRTVMSERMNTLVVSVVLLSAPLASPTVRSAPWRVSAECTSAVLRRVSPPPPGAVS
ncbi:hypothetical protein D3C71_966420 [compost metagenome]